MKIPETGIPDILRLFLIPCRKGERNYDET